MAEIQMQILQKYGIDIDKVNLFNNKLNEESVNKYLFNINSLYLTSS